MNVHIKSIVSALAFSMLFYSKSIGLNLFLISIIVVTLLVIIKKDRPFSWSYPLLYIFTAILVFINPTGFTIFVHFMTFLVFVGKTIFQKGSLYISWFIGLVNMIVASIANYNERENLPNKKKKNLSPKIVNYLKGSTVAVVLLWVFTLLYRDANPVFENLIAEIDLSFISIPWLLFTFIGYILFLHILRPYHARELIEFDKDLGTTLEKPNESFTAKTVEKLYNEHTLGSIVFGALNLLLLFFLVTDVIYLLQETNITNAEYSKSVHQGVYALMFSIICAIALILYFFRGNLNFFEGNDRLKIFTYIWIALNVILVLFTCYKNFEYVEALGLTYKRIGVFVYLLLILTGLVTAYIKVSQLKNFNYLVRTNLATLFAFLIVSAAVPWDRMITWYNLKKIEQVDVWYLIDLGETNSPQLIKYSKNEDAILNIDTLEAIDEKYQNFSKEQAEKTWQEFTLYQFTTNNYK